MIVIIMAAEMDHEARDCICSDQILIYYRITKKNNNNNIVTNNMYYNNARMTNNNIIGPYGMDFKLIISLLFQTFVKAF